MVNSLKEVAGEIKVPVDESKAWQTGFRVGVDSTIERLRQAVSDDGLPGIEPALQLPYDASGYKIDVVTPESP